MLIKIIKMKIKSIDNKLHFAPGTASTIKNKVNQWLQQ